MEKIKGLENIQSISGHNGAIYDAIFCDPFILLQVPINL